MGVLSLDLVAPGEGGAASRSVSGLPMLDAQGYGDAGTASDILVWMFVRWSPGWVRGPDGQWQEKPLPPVAPGTGHRYAVVAVWCGLLWGWGLLSVLAIVYGIAALKRIKKSREDGRGLAITGIVLGLIGLCFVAVATYAVS